VGKDRSLGQRISLTEIGCLAAVEEVGDGSSSDG